jgi:hypothetical protein
MTEYNKTKGGEIPPNVFADIIDELFNKGRIVCKCGGLLVNDFKDAYSCNTCKYYEIGGEVISNCDGSSTREFVIEETVFYQGKRYKMARMEATVGDLVMLDEQVNGKRIYKVRDFGGYETKSIVISNEIGVKNYTEYKVLIPVYKESC